MNLNETEVKLNMGRRVMTTWPTVLMTWAQTTRMTLAWM